MIERKKPRRRSKTETPDAHAVLAAADEQIADATRRLAELRQAGRDATITRAGLEEEIRAEQYRAGHESREPEGIAERRQRISDLDQAALDLEPRIRGAEQALRDAEAARQRALLDGYPVFAAELDEAEQRLLERRARVEAEVIEIRAAEVGHRARWTTLLRTVPGCERGISFLSAEDVGVQHSHGQAPEQTLHPYRRPEQADGLLIGIEPDETWPSWLRDAKARTIHPADSTDDTRQWLSAAGFEQQTGRPA